MVVFLTSSFIVYQPVEKYAPKPMDESYGFGDNLRRYWKENAHVLAYASDPEGISGNDHMAQELEDAFRLSGMDIGEVRLFDRRSFASEEEAPDAMKKALQWADVLFLAGGHAPTENHFMKLCRLPELIHDSNVFDGVVIGLSAGSVNAAREVYLIPEMKGESVDPEFVRFTSGLDLTDINIVPHSDYERTVILDGRKLVDDIVREDSRNRDIYLIKDGSYFLIRGGVTAFFGEGQIMRDGEFWDLESRIINTDNHRIRGNCSRESTQIIRMFESLAMPYYDWVLELNCETEEIEFMHVSEFMLANGIIPVTLDKFNELNWVFATKLVVDEEKSSVIEQTKTELIRQEIRKKGSYVRTVHIDTGDGVNAKSLRADPIAGDDRKLLVSLTDISLILDHDWMTDEYSRSGFLARAEKLLKEPAYQSGYSVVYTNIKGFKAVNDLLGTFSGDMVIFQTRDALEKGLNPVLIARLESDHFALIVKSELLTEERLKKISNQWYFEDTKKMPFCIQFGISHIAEYDESVQQMLDRAKLAENSIDAAHGDFYSICDEKMRDDYMNQSLLRSELDKGLERREFMPYFQPVLDAQSGEIVSAEALIRWKHQERGMISPGQFVPAFEKEGLISKVDAFMVSSVLEFNLRRQKEGLATVPCAVNLSRVDFFDVTIMEMIRHVAHTHKDIFQMLKLEVTESAYSALESDAIVFLTELKEMGVSLLLDDFGSGMSSLSTLESFDFDTIKLDMGFIAKIGKSKQVEAIIKHTIGMAHELGARVVAEGVETEAQLSFLREVKCDMIQGYSFYKPLPEDEFARVLG